MVLVGSQGCPVAEVGGSLINIRPAGRCCTATRLTMVTDLLRLELRAMNVIPSLPASEVARTRWSPN